MSINTRQFSHLTEMGISLWQSRQPQKSNANAIVSKATRKSPENINTSANETQTIHLETLAKKQCFTDILLAMELSIGEVKAEKNQLNLGLINWSFWVNKASPMTYLDNQLFTPEIDEIEKSPTLKKQLWQILNTQIL